MNVDLLDVIVVLKEQVYIVSGTSVIIVIQNGHQINLIAQPIPKLNPEKLKSKP